MGNFNRDNKFSGGKRFGGGGGGFGDRPSMHPATCSKCGRDCQVPFKPNGRKPIFCSDCFGSEGGGGGGGNFRQPERRDNVRTSFGDKPMFPAECSQCGNRCEVPFRPTGERPVYCRECFGSSDESRKRDSKPFSLPSAPSKGPAAGLTKDHFDTLNAKLDKIMKALAIGGNATSLEAEVITVLKEAEAKKPKAKKQAEEKPAAEKIAVEKPAAEKAAVEKPAKKKAAAKKPTAGKKK